MSDSVKQVDCVCGWDIPQAVYLVVDGVKWHRVTCSGCGRHGELRRDENAAIDCWNKDQRALKHFDAMKKALENIKRDCEVCSYDCQYCDDPYPITKTDLYDYAVRALKDIEGA